MLLVRPDSTSVLWLPETGELVAFGPRGSERWRTRLEAGRVLGTPAVAPDSTVFLRSERDLLAVQANGKIAWRRELPTPALAEGLLSPAALRDSGALAVVAPGRIELFTPDGSRRCAIELPHGPRINAPPAVASDGTVLVTTGEALLAWSDGCVPRWQRAVEPPNGAGR